MRRNRRGKASLIVANDPGLDYLLRMAALQKWLAVLVAMASLSFATSAQADILVRGDYGGKIRDYLNRWADYKASGKRVVLDGGCLSACTMFTSLPNACITERVILGFHQGTKSRATRTMRMMWPDKLRELVDKEGSLASFESGEFTLLYYNDLKDILPSC